MPDTKITALTALTAADPANDVLPIVDVSDTTMAASGTTKKISINNVLGCSGTATLASATITGNLTVDTNTLFVDAANNRVGIGTASPARPLDIVGSFQSSLGWVLTGTPAGLGAATRYIGGASTTDSWYFNALTGGNHLWAFGESLAMTLNSTGLGVGRSPSYRLQASSGTKATTASLATVAGITTTDADDFGIYFRLKTDATGANRYAAITAFDNGSGNGARDLVLQDLGGNVGVGVTPSAWRSGARAFQSGANGYLTLWEQANGSANLGFGVYEGSSNAFNYKTTGDATTLYSQLSGAHKWFTAPSGTAGNPITFTQAMTLDASGNLGIGVTSPAAKLHVEGSGPQARFSVATAVDARHEYYRNGIREGLLYWDANLIGLYATQSSGELVLASANTIRVRINSAGDTISNVTATPPTLSTNRQMVFNLTSDTNLRISVRGTDGTTRTANITLA